MRRPAVLPLIASLALMAAPASAQRATRLALLQAENRRAPTAADLATLRAGARSTDPQTARIGLRALGRLERPALIPDIVPGLRHRLPEVRAEAANAVAQAAQGLHGTGTGRPGNSGAAVSTSAIAAAESALIARLASEADPGVRAALCESLARLPYTAAADAARAESALLAHVPQARTSSDRLGLAKAFEAFTRLHHDLRPASADTLEALRLLAATGDRSGPELLRDARVRRLALQSLMTAGAAGADLVRTAAADPDPQVRRLAMQAAVNDGPDAVVRQGLTDASPLVRIEALRTARLRNTTGSCSQEVPATSDPDMLVAIVAIDQLGICGGDPGAVALLAQVVADVPDAEAPRNWHRAAHALVALAAAAPERAAAALPAFAGSRTWQLRAAAVRAAAIVRRRDIVERLARDPDDNVVDVAVSSLKTLAGHEADDIYLAALARSSHATVRAAALALEGAPKTDAITSGVSAALARAADDRRAGGIDTRSALRTTLASIGVPPRPSPSQPPQPAPLTDAELRRLAAPRARFTIRDVGMFDVALFTMEAPATVLQFAQLAASGYYNGLTFHRLVPNGVIQGGSPGANEYDSDAPIMRDEVGLWPHVRGAVGISTRGRDTGDGQIFIDLVDNPRYDHTYTVFAQVLNGLEIVDRLLEGDVIERVEILP